MAARGRKLGLVKINYCERDKTQTGPKGLAALVVHQAIRDALNPPSVGKGISAERASPKDRADAVSFCTDEAGEWASARTAWCDAAGILPDAVRFHVLHKMAEARGGA